MSKGELNYKKCALCRCSNKLQESHYIPKSFMNVVRKSLSPEDSAPVIANLDTGIAVQTNFQAKQKLLCENCESRFSKYGERDVAGLCFRGESEFKIRELLGQVAPSLKHDGKKIWYGGKLNQIDYANAFYYFAISLLWRGSVVRWPSPYGEFFGVLGNTYTESFRRYLLNPLLPIPNTLVDVYVDFDAQPKAFVSFPSTLGRQKFVGYDCRVHDFIIPGLRFRTLVGGSTEKISEQSSDRTRVCFHEKSFVESGIMSGVQKLVLRTEPKGKLAKGDK